MVASLFLLTYTAIALLAVPIDSWRTLYADACHLATVGGVATVVALLVTQRLGARGHVVERRLLAVFLAAMPLVYVASWFEAKGSLAWLTVELLGVPVFGGLAFLGLRRSPWWLVFGIAAHGLGWDSWHSAGVGVVPAWYSTGCLVLDAAIAIYVAARLEALVVAPA